MVSVILSDDDVLHILEVSMEYRDRYIQSLNTIVDNLSAEEHFSRLPRESQLVLAKLHSDSSLHEDFPEDADRFLEDMWEVRQSGAYRIILEGVDLQIYNWFKLRN